MPRACSSGIAEACSVASEGPEAERVSTKRPTPKAAAPSAILLPSGGGGGEGGGGGGGCSGGGCVSWSVDWACALLRCCAAWGRALLRVSMAQMLQSSQEM